MLLGFNLMVSAQNRVVTGSVSDNTGAPVGFVTITQTGTSNSVAADENGRFSISVPANARLTVTATGMQPKTVTASGDGPLNIVLDIESGELSEVVVTTALGIKRQAKELGYATASVGNKVLNQGRAVNVQQALNGKVSGLSVATTNSGVFEEAKINIRGIRSLTGNNSPLLVVDGAPTPLDFLSSIPPGDIQDLTILKSSASAAIYGPDAVNGVIVVTTNRGKGNKLDVTFSTSVQLARVAYFPKIQREFGAGAGETVDDYGNYLYVPYENQMYGSRFDGSIQPIGIELEDGSIQEGPYSDLHYKDKTNFWNTGITTQNSVSVAGENFYVSLNDAKIKGLMPKDENRRTSFRFNGSKESGKLSVNYGLNYVLQNYDVVNEFAVANLFPRTYGGSIFFQVLQTPSNVPLLDYKDWRNDKFAQYSNYYNEFAINPYWAIDNIRLRGRSDVFIGTVDANYQLFPWLKATARVSTNLNFSNSKTTTAPVDVSDWALANRSGSQYSADIPGNVFDQQTYRSRINFDYYLSGDKDVSDFNVRYLVGGLVRENRSKDVSIGGNNLVVPGLYNVTTRSGDASVPAYPFSNYDIQSRLVSGYANVGLGYKDWAFIDLTGRNDWDSRLSAENRSFFYPGASASVILSDAISMLSNSNLISYLKLRGAYSKSGNVNLDPYALSATYSQPAGFPFGDVVGFTANPTIPSPSLEPEFVVTREVGFELGLLRNRFNLDLTYFNQKSDNQILQISQSSTTGYTTGLANAASFKNYGVETDVALTPLVNIGKGKIDLRVNVTYNDNKVLSTFGNIPVVVGGNNQFTQIAGSSPTANNIAIVGSPAFAFQLTDYLRDSLGRVIVDPVSGNPSLAPELVVKGRSLPLWVMGITPSYSIGEFTFSMTWDYKAGHNFYAGIGSDMDFAGISARSAAYGRQRFVFPNSVYMQDGKYVPNTNVQVQDGNYSFWATDNTNSAIATNYFASAAAWRLREVNITYNFPLKWFGNGKVVKRVSLSAVGRNLLLFVPESNQWGDPEFNEATGTNTFGLSSVFQSPAQRLFGGSLIVGF